MLFIYTQSLSVLQALSKAKLYECPAIHREGGEDGLLDSTGSPLLVLRTICP